ncbi:MAG: radical SAM family heme chaperone HemW [Prevotellaceae bacterium]|jgi:oxygen-independent coproporphyrinogen-3 oxidase|nr:radical SAM family heme chaperone HemW [Prevotellaceae bacterium]
MSAIYIHIPFCKQLCYYCDFHFSVSLARKNEMLDAIVKEIQMRSNELNDTLETLYFGGGTPSIYSPDELKIITDEVKKSFSVNNFREFTIEVNPDDLNEKYLEDLQRLGVNRLSIGIQSFIDEHLRFMNRRHTAKQSIECIKTAQNAGFKNINIDLIYGLPQLELQQWRKNINIFIDLDIPHLSAYHLGIEPRTVFYKRFEKGELKPADEKSSIKQYEMLEKMTSDAGFEHYEISNFAKNSFYSIHNTTYWQDKPYIGFGASAHSYDGNNLRRWNIANNKKYIDAVNANQKFWESEHLNIEECYNDYVLTSLRTVWGANVIYIKKKFGEKLYDYFFSQSQRFMQQGLLICNGSQIKIPSKYFLLSDAIMRELLWVE